MRNSLGLYRQNDVGSLSLHLRCLHDFPRDLVVPCSLSSPFLKSINRSLWSSEASDISDQRSCDSSKIITPDLSGAVYNLSGDQNPDISSVSFIKIAILKLSNYTPFSVEK